MRLVKVTASALVIMVVASVVLLFMPLPVMPEPGLAGNFLLRNVHVIDVHTGGLMHNRDIAVSDGIITQIVSTGEDPGEDRWIEIDGTGKYAMPGLWDMHTHSTKLASQYLHPLFLANGLTGVREMWGCMSEPDSYIACQEDRRRWNDALLDGSAASPRFILHSSFQINGGNEVPAGYPAFFKARDEREARQLAAYYADSGTDFLKTYSQLSPTSYNTLADEARKRGLSLAGHRPLGISLRQMLSAGQRSVEHPRLFLLECYGGAAEFRALTDPLAAYTMELRGKLLKDHDAQACADLMAAMADSETAWLPTLQVLRMSALAGDKTFRADRRLKYIPWPIRLGMWGPDADRAAAQSRVEGREDIYRDLYKMALAQLAQAHAAGVEVLIGTDAGDTHVFPGFSVHDELTEFVAAGISPADVIKIATLGAAQFSGMAQTFGSLEVGKTADILLLDANPLQNILATQKIYGMLFNGQYFSRTALDQLLSFAEQQAGSVQFNLHLLWSLVSSPIVRMQFAD